MSNILTILENCLSTMGYDLCHIQKVGENAHHWDQRKVEYHTD
jgi:hypothetical protein